MCSSDLETLSVMIRRLRFVRSRAGTIAAETPAMDNSPRAVGFGGGPPNRPGGSLRDPDRWRGGVPVPLLARPILRAGSGIRKGQFHVPWPLAAQRPSKPAFRANA